ncbi:hypothetical protein BJX61DRAFT_266992 [Aspergillus egyptiacus]|nr:hypothetical protein BJX61DRAFT_266992 [Aspergillus egyptiacus]
MSDRERTRLLFGLSSYPPPCIGLRVECTFALGRVYLVWMRSKAFCLGAFIRSFVTRVWFWSGSFESVLREWKPIGTGESGRILDSLDPPARRSSKIIRTVVKHLDDNVVIGKLTISRGWTIGLMKVKRDRGQSCVGGTKIAPSRRLHPEHGGYRSSLASSAANPLLHSLLSPAVQL